MGESSEHEESDLTSSAGDCIGRLSLSTRILLCDMCMQALVQLLSTAVNAQCTPGTGLENMKWDRDRVA